jgi:hypothetical protein
MDRYRMLIHISDSTGRRCSRCGADLEGTFPADTRIAIGTSDRGDRFATVARYEHDSAPDCEPPEGSK